jgi:predicted nucleotidyltransferase
MSEQRDSRIAAGAPGLGGGVAPAVLDEIIRRIVEVAQPDRIILFGSAARGEMGPDSDIDLLVVKSGVSHRRRLEGDIYMNLSGVGVGVDVIVATPEDVEYLKDSVGSIIRPALREGREVYVAEPHGSK